MDNFTLQQKLFLISFDLTTPLVSLGGFCDLTKANSKSQLVAIQLDTIKEAVEHIKHKKDFLRDKIIDDNDPDFTSEIKAVNFLRVFASELQPYERKIAKSLDELLDKGFETEDPAFEKWAVNISTNALKKLRKILGALSNIQTDLELKIQDD